MRRVQPGPAIPPWLCPLFLIGCEQATLGVSGFESGKPEVMCAVGLASQRLVPIQRVHATRPASSSWMQKLPHLHGQRDAPRRNHTEMETAFTWPRVVIVGGGFGGLYAARSLVGAPLKVTLIDKRNYHLFRPMPYQVATGLLSADEISGPLRSILNRQSNVDVLLGEVSGVDTQKRVVCVKQHEVPYDFAYSRHRRSIQLLWARRLGPNRDWSYFSEGCRQDSGQGTAGL